MNWEYENNNNNNRTNITRTHTYKMNYIKKDTSLYNHAKETHILYSLTMPMKTNK